MGINKVILVGHVGKDPEVKDINGNKLAEFSLATTESYKDKNGEKQTSTEWHNCQVWGNLAGVIEKWVKKGQQLYVEGKIKTSSYQKNDETRYMTRIVVNSIEMIGQKQQQQPQQETMVNESESDDLPF